MSVTTFVGAYAVEYLHKWSVVVRISESQLRELASTTPHRARRQICMAVRAARRRNNGIAPHNIDWSALTFDPPLPSCVAD